jgi:site-specific recombinase XerD
MRVSKTKLKWRFSVMKIIELLESYLNISNLKKETVRRYKYLIKTFLNFSGTDIEKINLDIVREFLNYLKDTKNLSIGTINDYRTGIKYLFEVVLDKGWNDRKIPYIRGYKTLPAILEKSETIELIGCIGNIIFRAILMTIYSSGLRIQEAINLKISDIDPKRMQIYIRESKSGSGRYAILSEKNLEYLREYLKRHPLSKNGKWKPEDYLFCTSTRKKPVCKRAVREALKYVLEQRFITKKITVHSLRHGFAVHSLEDGMDVFHVKELLGHNSIVSTCQYLKLVDARRFGGKSPLDT